jgi:Flp pilus assembly protein TadD
MVDRLLAMNPRNDDALFNKSIALERQGRRAEAFAAMKKACEIKPDNKEYKLRLSTLS